MANEQEWRSVHMIGTTTRQAKPTRVAKKDFSDVISTLKSTTKREMHDGD